MTTSPLPWTTRNTPPDSKFGQGTEVLDTSGRFVAFFRDWRDAEAAIEGLSAARERDKLEDQVYDLQEEIKALQATRR